MKVKIFYITFFAILATTATAAEYTEELEQFNETTELEELQQTINDNRDEIPDFISTIVGGQQINLYFNNTDYTYSAKLDGTEIQELSSSELEEPTLEIWVDPSTLQSVLQSDESFDEIEQAMEQGGIEYETHNWRNSIVFYITEKIFNITSKLGITS